MTIAIDFDNTWTRDPEFWAAFVSFARQNGHDMVMVTGRSGDGEWGDQVRAAVEVSGLPIVFAGMRWKRDAATRAGWRVDVWVDDKPEYIAPQSETLAAPKVAASN